MNKALKYDWYFYNDDLEGDKVTEIPDYFKQVRVPHDWAISGKFDIDHDRQYGEIIADGLLEKSDLVARTGALPFFGPAWYLRKITLDSQYKGKRIFLDFDGVMSNSTVYVNGTELGHRPYGYSSFSYEISNQVEYNKENIIAVRACPETSSSRWYPGAGIYRNVYLRIENPTHVAKNGTWVTTNIKGNQATINIETRINGPFDGYDLKTLIYEGEKLVAQDTLTLSSKVVKQTLQLDQYKLWSVENPFLYTAKSVLIKNNKDLPAYMTTFGIRTIDFHAKKGFFLNGESMKLKGVCMHHDLGALGAAVNKSGKHRQLKLLKEMGCNAIRTSHNPPSVELLDLCDELGFLVIDEAFDEWRYGKVDNGYFKYFDQWAEADLTDMIIRDRNHPSIIMWSTGNEVLDQSYEDGKDTARFLTDICHKLDPTRPVTAGFNNSEDAIKFGLANEVDIPGFNYKPHFYDRYTKEHPEWIIYGSETESCTSTRGVYHFPVEEQFPADLKDDLTCSSYDLVGPAWACSPDKEFDAQDRNPNILGEFVWTGFDYLGEPTPYRQEWPSRSSYFGILDLCGIPKDRYYSYQAKWSGKDVLHVFPHWDFEERIGKIVPVHAYTNFNKGELFVNGVSQGIVEKNDENIYTQNRLIWDDVIYQPGEIKVVVFDEKDQVAMERVTKTSQSPRKISALADRSEIRADGDDLAYITLSIVDELDSLCARANNPVDISIEGPGELVAVDNGDQTSLKPFLRNTIEAFSGKAVVTVRSIIDTPGNIVISLSSKNLEIKKIVIKTI